MRVPVSWLREYVPLEMPLEDLVDRLSVSVAEVEGIERPGVVDESGNLGRFVVGRVVEAAKHPNADRLQLCRVDMGEREPRQIVCGAWNFGAGATVAVALPGAMLPNGLTLDRRKVRGELSDGMILAEDEVGLGTDHAGIMLLPDGLEPGAPLADHLPIADAILHVEATGNRPDLLSIYGLAREVAALYDLELAPAPGADPGIPGKEPVHVEIEDPEGCPRYDARIFHEVRIAASPLWLRTRLTAAGMRPISNVVDVTNYVMLALGSPLHAFDLSSVRGSRIVVRRARAGERLRTLDGVLRELHPDDLVIADAEGPIALAGIMGGAEAEIGEATADVLLETANFEPYSIFRTSERLRLRSESSNRWEKGVDAYLVPQAAALATGLILDLCDARWAGHEDVRANLPERPVITFRAGRADALIGLETPLAQQHALLGRLGFDIAEECVTAPTWRARDVTREVDVIEEVARFRLPQVPFTLPLRRAMFGRLTKLQRVRRRVEETLAGLGFVEVYTPSLRESDADPDALRLPEPITVELAELRTALLSSLVEPAARNAGLGAEGVALFELARVYLPSGGPLPHERLHVAGILEGDFARAKGAVEALHAALKAPLDAEAATNPLLHPGKAARLAAGWVGELDPRALEGTWGAFELDLGVLAEASVEPVPFEDVITFPALRQDLAVVVDEEVPAAELVAVAREAAEPELRRARVFDVYRGEQVPEGRKSVALALEFRSADKTLTDEDAAPLRNRIIAALHDRFGAELRA